MATGIYRGVDGVARKVKTPYIGVDGVARKVTTAYHGVDGVARKCYQGGPPPLDKASWAEISEIAASGQASNFWAVGDCKAVYVKGSVGEYLSLDTTLYVYIIGFDHNGATNTIDFGTFKTSAEGGVDVCLVDTGYNNMFNGSTAKRFNLNHGSNMNSGGWKGCDLRYDILGSVDKAPSGYRATSSQTRSGYDATTTCATNPVSGTLMAALPSDLRAVMKPMTIYTDNKGGGGAYLASGNISSSVDYLPLMSTFEVYGATGVANSTEKNSQARYAYYSGGNNRVKYRHDSTSTTAWYWSRSPYYDDAISFVNVTTAGTVSSFGATCKSEGIAPIFRV